MFKKINYIVNHRQRLVATESLQKPLETFKHETAYINSISTQQAPFFRPILQFSELFPFSHLKVFRGYRRHSSPTRRLLFYLWWRAWLRAFSSSRWLELSAYDRSSTAESLQAFPCYQWMGGFSANGQVNNRKKIYAEEEEEI